MSQATETVIPSDLAQLLVAGRNYGKLATQISETIHQRLTQDYPESTPEQLTDIHYHYENLEDRYRKIHRNTRVNAQECLTVLLHNTNALTELSQELDTPISDWKYWCWRNIRY